MIYHESLKGKWPKNAKIDDLERLEKSLQQKCRHGRRITDVDDSKQTLQTRELVTPFPKELI